MGHVQEDSTHAVTPHVASNEPATFSLSFVPGTWKALVRWGQLWYNHHLLFLQIGMVSFKPIKSVDS